LPGFSIADLSVEALSATLAADAPRPAARPHFRRLFFSENIE